MLNQQVDEFRARAGVEHDAPVEEVMRAIAAAFPTDIHPYLQLGDLARNQGKPDEATRWYDQASRVGPHNFWPYYLRAKIAEAGKDYARSLGYLEVAFEMCAGHVSKEEYDNIAKYYCDLRAIQSNADVSFRLELLGRPNKLGAPLANAMRVSLVKDEDDIIYAGLLASYRSGFRYFVIADNGSQDNTVAEIRRFASDHPDALVYVVLDPIVAHYQAAKTMGIARLGCTALAALDIHIDWIFALDGDEELHIPEDESDLATILSDADQAGAKLLTYVFCNASAAAVIEDNRRIDDLPGAYVLNSPPADLPVRKVAFRMTADAYIEEGNHFCSFGHLSAKEILIGSDHALSLKHYPVRSLEQLRKKVINGERSLQGYVGPSYIGEHWRRDAQSFASEGDAFLHEKMRRYVELISGYSR